MDIVIHKTVIINNGENDWNRTIENRVHGITRKAYGWSKYGGKKLGLVQESKTEEWNCQACGEKQGSELPSYMFECLEGEFIRICTLCQSRKITNGITQMSQLLDLVRIHLAPWY